MNNTNKPKKLKAPIKPVIPFEPIKPSDILVRDKINLINISLKELWEKCDGKLEEIFIVEDYDYGGRFKLNFERRYFTKPAPQAILRYETELLKYRQELDKYESLKAKYDSDLKEYNNALNLRKISSIEKELEELKKVTKV